MAQSKAITLLERANAKLNSYKTKLASAKETTRSTVGTIVRSATIGTTAFGFGAIAGRTKGGVEVGGVPLEVIIGGGAWLGGVFGVAGDHSHHLTAIGDGALAALANNLGRGVGENWREKIEAAQQGVKEEDSKALTTKGIHMTPEELDMALHGQR